MIDKIIWNNLEYHHLMMYCEEKWIYLYINYDWNIELSDMRIIAKLDNTKKFKDESYYFSEIIDMIDNGELLDKLGLTELYENNNNRK